MRKSAKLFSLILSICVLSSIFLLSSCTLIHDLYGVYKLEYMSLSGHKIKCGNGGLTEDYYVLIFREDSSFTIICNDEETPKNGTWTQIDDKTYSLILDGDAESDEERVLSLVFKLGKCKLIFDEGELVLGFKYYGAET